MTMNAKASGAWKTVRYVYAKVSGSWKDVGQIFCKVNGTWYPVWSYSWVTGSYGSCSADCGGGTQTRSVTCTRNDGYTMDDSLCVKYVGSKPAASQSCNTQDCIECYEYERGQYGGSAYASTVGSCRGEVASMEMTLYWNGSVVSEISDGYRYYSNNCSTDQQCASGGSEQNDCWCTRTCGICREPA